MKIAFSFCTHTKTPEPLRGFSSNMALIANATWYVTNQTLHTDFNISYISEVIRERINKHHNMEAHPNNPLLELLLKTTNTRRLIRCWPLDIAG
jgi:hypothetical protein